MKETRLIIRGRDVVTAMLVGLVDQMQASFTPKPDVVGVIGNLRRELPVAQIGEGFLSCVKQLHTRKPADYRCDFDCHFAVRTNAIQMDWRARSNDDSVSVVVTYQGEKVDPDQPANNLKLILVSGTNPDPDYQEQDPGGELTVTAIEALEVLALRLGASRPPDEDQELERLA